MTGTEGEKTHTAVTGVINSLTRSQITFVPAALLVGDGDAADFYRAVEVWCEVMLKHGLNDPRTVDPVKLVEWYQGVEKSGVVDLVTANAAMLSTWGNRLTFGSAHAAQLDVSAEEAPKTRPEDQPLPGIGREAVQDALIKLIRERRDLGIRRYGRPLETFNGRDAVRDALEEAIDLSVYLMQIRLEVAEMRDRTTRAENMHLTTYSRAITAIDYLKRQCGFREEYVKRAMAILNGDHGNEEEASGAVRG